MIFSVFSSVIIVLLSFTAILSTTKAFVVRPNSLITKAITTTTKTNLFGELPKFDGKTQRWIPTGPNQLPEAGYPPTKTLLLQGPKPFLTRIFQKDDYEQAVLKFMAGDNIVDRNKAQGNMDAYLRNPQDWMYNRMESERFGREIDYSTIRTKDVALVIVWSCIVVWFVGNLIYKFAVIPLLN